MAAHQPTTIGTLRDQHLKTMTEWHELKDGDVEQRFRLASEMRQAALDAGASIESPTERDEAQGIVDYWASTIAGLEGYAYPAIVDITDYAQEQATTAGLNVREAYDGLESAEAQRIARRVLEELLVLTDQGVERGRPRSREALRKSSGTDDPELFDRVMQTLVESGGIVLRTSESPEDDCFEAVDGRISDSWPTLLEWLSDARTYNAERNHLMEQAQQWIAAKKDPSLLLVTSSAVDKALSYRGENELLDDYIGTSLRDRNAWRRIVQLVSFVLVIILGIAAFYYYNLAARKQAELDKAKAQSARAIDIADKAESIVAQAKEANAAALANAEIANQPDALSLPGFERVKQSISPASGAVPDAALERLPNLFGAMWLGSDKTPQIANLQGGDVGAIAQARPGTRYRSKVQIYLRTAMPNSNEDYGRPKEKAIIPPGVQIVLLSKPRSFKRATGNQYWANVRIVPQVYVQFNNASRAQVDGVREQLAAAGFEVPAGEQRRDFRGRAEVRYFQPADRPIAAQLQRVANQIPAIATAGQVDCKSFAGPVGPSFKLELWYDARRPPSMGPVRPCE